MFSITEPIYEIDGFIHQIFKFWDRFQKVKEKVFKHPELNPYVVSMDYEESAVRANMDILKERDVFYPTTGINELDLSYYTFKTTNEEGMDAWTTMDKNKYESKIFSVWMFEISALFLCFILMF